MVSIIIRLFFALLPAAAAFAQAPPATAPAAQDLGGARQRLQELQMQLGQVDGQLMQLGRRRSGMLVELHGIALRASNSFRFSEPVAKLGKLGRCEKTLGKNVNCR